MDSEGRRTATHDPISGAEGIAIPLSLLFRAKKGFFSEKCIVVWVVRSWFFQLHIHFHHLNKDVKKLKDRRQEQVKTKTKLPRLMVPSHKFIRNLGDDHYNIPKWIDANKHKVVSSAKNLVLPVSFCQLQAPYDQA